ncbi:MAG: tRNA (guanosine(46)-N7)-methyltransferase TrmB [Clostridiales Family XIII bacterium]|nr:tRNA (guanosine(46)-N7)-methyltransferase TrmB [Clostridiales Family XIII bacterium]
MRQRRIKDIGEKVEAYRPLILDAQAVLSMGDHPGRWYQRSVERAALPEGFEEVYVEFGCGRGRFINALAAGAGAGGGKALFVGVEGCQSVLIKALKKTAAAGLANVRYLASFVNDASEAFAPSSVDGIYLNFSDPWPKDRHEMRRLTSPRHSKGYFTVLKDGGFLALKTDDEGFFLYSKEKLAEAGFAICGEGDAQQTPMTEYEARFRALGKTIYYCKAEKPTKK